MGDFFQRRGKTGRSRLINEEENEDSETGSAQHSVSYGATIRGRSVLMTSSQSSSSGFLAAQYVEAVKSGGYKESVGRNLLPPIHPFISRVSHKIRFAIFL